MGNSTTGRHGQGATVYAAPHRERFAAAARTRAPRSGLNATGPIESPPLHDHTTRQRLENAAARAGIAIEDAALIAARAPLSELAHHAQRLRRLEQAALETTGLHRDRLSLGERDALRAEAAITVARHPTRPLADLLPHILRAMARRRPTGTSSDTTAAAL
jgi:hypothetical protein